MVEGELRQLETAELVARLLAIVDILVERAQGAASSSEVPRARATPENERTPDNEPGSGRGRCSQHCFFCSTACAREEEGQRVHRCREHGQRRA